MTIPTPQDLDDAYDRIKRIVRRTPVLTSSQIDGLIGANVYFKCENFQTTGSFKFRGATNAVLSCPEAVKAQGFATHSSGNHAQALAKAAQSANVKAYIVMPRNAPSVKVAAVEGYGGEITFCEPTEASRISTCNAIIEKTGAKFIPPFEYPDVISGQSTAAREMLEEKGDLDAVFTPVGGGGLAAGTALYCKNYNPNIEVVLGEPDGANDTYLSFQLGEVTSIPKVDTIADGLKTTVGKLNFQIIKEHVSQVITVSEEEIIAAMRLIWERMKIIVEPSCAVPFAALIKEKEKYRSKKIGIILTGGNVDLGRLPF